jgi:hypothetical protein
VCGNGLWWLLGVGGGVGSKGRDSEGIGEVRLGEVSLDPSQRATAIYAAPSFYCPLILFLRGGRMVGWYSVTQLVYSHDTMRDERFNLYIAEDSFDTLLYYT